MTQSIIELHTPRLRLRQWHDTDRCPFAALNADPEVMAFFPAPLSREQSDRLVDRFAQSIADRGWGCWAVELNDDAQLAGFVGLNMTDPRLPFSPRVEIAWRLATHFWGKGYATEAARACLHIGFMQLGLEEIVAFTAVGNMRSIAVMQRLGMRRDPALFEHPALPQGHPLRSHCLYRLPSNAMTDPE